jgi:hypothetical protein
LFLQPSSIRAKFLQPPTSRLLNYDSMLSP